MMQIAKEHVLPLVTLAIWYLLAGLLGALAANRSRIDMWCATYPKLALVVHVLRATGLDWVKLVAAVRDFARSKAGLPPATLLPVLGVLIGLGATVLCDGCSLESARYRRAARSPFDESLQMSRSTRPVDRCQTWDTIHVWGDWVAGGLASSAAVAGGLAVQTESRDFSKGMAWTALGAGAVSAVSLGWASQSAASWTEAGCGQ